MPEGKIIPQIQFASLDDFFEGSNNFFSLFFDNHMGRRNEPFYQRFKKINPALARELDEAMTIKRYNEGKINDVPLRERFPWDKLWEAYKIMSQCVYEGDIYVAECMEQGNQAGFLVA